MSHQTTSHASAVPAHHVYFQPNNPEDVMVIEVNFGKGRKDDIFVAVGDDPIFLAQAFVEKHNLKPSAVSMIADHIANSIEVYMAKLEDEERRNKKASSPVTAKNGDISFGVSPIREHRKVNDSMYVNPASPLRHASSGNWGQDVDAAAAAAVETVGGDQVHGDGEEGEADGREGEEDGVVVGDIDPEGYNKLRNSWNGSSLLQTKSAFENQLSRSKKGSALIISKAKAVDSRSVRLVVNPDDSKRGKVLNTNERLYWGAKVQRERMEAKINQSVMTQDIELRVGQESVKVKGKSKQLLKNYRVGDSQLVVSERLYQDGLRQKERREKESEKAKARVKKEDWSCPLCCTFNEQPPRESDPKVCASCSWTGSMEEATFKPVAVDLHYSMSNVDRQKLVKNYYKRRGVENITDQDKNSVFENLHKNNIHNKEAMELLQKRWTEEDNEMTFKPAIPGKSKQIAEKINRQLVNTSMQQSGDSCSVMSHLGVSERLYHQSTVARDSARQSESMDKSTATQSVAPPPQPSASEVEFLNRMTYEYEERQKRKEALEKQFYSKDPRTAQPLFKPTIPKFSNPYAVQLDDESVEIHEKLIRSGDERKFRLMQLQEEYRKIEMSEFKKSSHTLPTSQKILEESSENSIGEIFRVLLTCQMHNEAKGLDASDTGGSDSLDHERLLRLSAELSNWRQGVLDAAHCDPDLMIDSVRHLLVEVVELSHKHNCNAKYPELCEKMGGAPRLLDLEMFSVLIKRCIRNREGGGKSYLFLPRKEPKPAPAAEEPTFRPVIGATSLKIVRDSRDKEVPIEDQLLNSQLEVRVRIEKCRQALEAKEASKCTFRPALIPPPASVRPTYRAIGSPVRGGGAKKGALWNSARPHGVDPDGGDVPPPPPLPHNNNSSAAAGARTTVVQSKGTISYDVKPGLRLALDAQGQGREADGYYSKHYGSGIGNSSSSSISSSSSSNDYLNGGAPPPPPLEDPAASSSHPTTTTWAPPALSDDSDNGSEHDDEGDSNNEAPATSPEHIVPADSSDQYIGITDSADQVTEEVAGHRKDSLASYHESIRHDAVRNDFTA